MGFLLSETHKRLINAIILAVYITLGTRDSPYNTRTLFHITGHARFFKTPSDHEFSYISSKIIPYSWKRKDDVSFKERTILFHKLYSKNKIILILVTVVEFFVGIL